MAPLHSREAVFFCVGGNDFAAVYFQQMMNKRGFRAGQPLLEQRQIHLVGVHGELYLLQRNRIRVGDHISQGEALNQRVFTVMFLAYVRSRLVFENLYSIDRHPHDARMLIPDFDLCRAFRGFQEDQQFDPAADGEQLDGHKALIDQPFCFRHILFVCPVQCFQAIVRVARHIAQGRREG